MLQAMADWSVENDERLTTEAEREGKLAAYRDLTVDDERLEAIRAASRLAVEHGLL